MSAPKSINQKEQIDHFAKAAEDAKARFDEMLRNIGSELEATKSDLQSQIGKIQRKADGLRDLEQSLQNIETTANTVKINIESVYQSIKDQEESFKIGLEQTSSNLSQLIDRQSTLERQVASAEEMHAGITDFHDELLVNKSDANGQITSSCIKTNINNLYNEIRRERDLQKGKFEELYKELSDKILSLLPGAGAAGLASSYYEAKMRYTTTNDISSLNDGPSKLPWRMFINQFSEYTLYMILFLGPLLGVVYMFYDFKYPVVFEGQPYAILLYKLTMTFPCLAISTYGLVSIITNRRLYESYNHKQRVMQLYHSFKKEIDETSDDSLKAKLLNIMLDVVKERPSPKLDRHDQLLLKNLQQPVLRNMEHQ